MVYVTTRATCRNVLLTISVLGSSFHYITRRVSITWLTLLWWMMFGGLGSWNIATHPCPVTRKREHQKRYEGEIFEGGLSLSSSIQSNTWNRSWGLNWGVNHLSAEPLKSCGASRITAISVRSNIVHAEIREWLDLVYWILITKGAIDVQYTGYLIRIHQKEPEEWTSTAKFNTSECQVVMGRLFWLC